MILVLPLKLPSRSGRLPRVEEANSYELYRAAGSLCEEIDGSILSIRGEKETKLDMSKLY
jgi:hypothetical protein